MNDETADTTKETESTAATETPHQATKLGIGISIMLVLATIATLLTFIALWANRQILSTDQWTKTSTELLESPAVQDALANYLVEELFNNIDVQAELEKNLPDQLDGLAGPATGGLRQLALRGAETALEQPAVQEAWKNANRVAHRQLIQALEGGSATVSTEGGVVTINTRLLLVDLAKQVGLPTSLVNKLPDSVGEFTVLRSDELKKAQDAESALKGMTWVFGGLAILLYVLSIWLAATRRRRAVFFCGLSFVVVGLLVLLIQSFARGPVVEALATTTSLESAVQDIYTTATELIKQMSISLLFSGLLVMAASWLAGPYRHAVGFRRAVAPYLREYLPMSIGVAALLFLLLVWWAPTAGFRTTTGLLINLTLAIAGFVALTLMTRREFPDAKPADLTAIGDWFTSKWHSTREWTTEQTRNIDLPRPGGGGDKSLDELERLQRLHKEGALTDEEFADAKKKLLSG